MINKRWIYPSVLLTAAGMTAFEIFMIRFFSLAHFGPYLYMPISVAVLGAGLAALVIGLFEKKIKPKIDWFLGLSLSLSILFVSIGFLILKQIEFHPAELINSYFLFQKFFQILIFYLFLLLPFFFGAFFVILSFTSEKTHLGTITLFEQMGAGAGILLFLAASLFVPVSYLIFIPVALFSAAAFLIISHEIRIYQIILSGVVLVSLAFPVFFQEIPFMPYKDIVRAEAQGGRVILSKESPFGKLDVMEQAQKKLWAGISETYTGKAPEFLGIFVDGNRISEFVKGDQPGFLDYTPYKIAYELKKNPSVLALKTGGGLEVLAAAHFNARSVSAVEKNHQIIELLQERFSNYTAGIFHKRNVLFYRSGVRPFIASVNKKFDLITTGIYPLEENAFRDEPDYTLTEEALKDYVSLLEKDGILMIRIPLQNPPRMELRILSTLRAFLVSSGLSDRQLKTLKTSDSFVFFLKQNPFSAEENTKIKELASNLKYDLIFPLDGSFKNPLYTQPVQAIFQGDLDALKPYDFSLTAITDNDPFVYYSLKIHRVFSIKEIPRDEMGYVILWLSFLAALLAGGMTLYLPVVLRRDYHKKFHLSKVIFYFGGIGAGVMMVQIALIHKVNVLFSSMMVSAGMVFASFFIFSGLGSYFARRFAKKVQGILISLSSLGALLLLYLFFSDALISALVGFKMIFRLGFAFLISAPIAFFAGMPFTLGLEWVKHFDEGIIPWSFGIHTALSVVSAVLSVILGIKLGLSWLFLIALFFYAAALGSFFWMDRFYQKTNYLYRRYRV